jgi:hypothetical protein
MIFRLMLLLASLLPISGLWGQKHDAYLFIGYGVNSGNPNPKFGTATLNFKYSPPKIIKENLKIDFYVACASCSDSSGKLLFYSNGIRLHNATKNLMQNGDSINAISDIWGQWKQDGYPVPYPMHTIPYPSHPNQYFMFHQPSRLVFVNGSGMFEEPQLYSRIDMNKNNGVGRVMEKNKFLIDGSTIESSMVKHGNGRDWWLVTGLKTQPIQYVVRIDENGVGTPWDQTYGPPFPDEEYAGATTFSPDGRTYIRHDQRHGLRIFDFDRCSGQLSNLRIIPYENGFFTNTLLFSADGRYVYLCSLYALMVLDMQAPDPALTLDTLAYYDGFATPIPFNTAFWMGQLQEDGKIYYATTNGTLALHVVHHPELPGLAANVQQHGITLPVYNGGTMCRFPNYRLGRWAGSPCDTLPFAGPVEEHFRHQPYEAQREPDALTWRVLSPLRGKGQLEHDWPDAQTWMLQQGPPVWRKKE